MIARDVDAIPLIAVDRVVDDVMRPAVSVDEADAATAVRINQIIDDQRAGVAAINRDTTITRAAAVTKYSIELDMYTNVTVVTAHHRDRLSASASNRQSTYRDELGLLDTNGKFIGALGTG